ncbi:hypothetical protein ACPA54_31715 [Uniformispora flossi]|uniref:Uncharacterized protein n=1 Tax=Yinghuangia aomiensis TaxID=676205 RepID=A0ABP9IA19_9ACTN
MKRDGGRTTARGGKRVRGGAACGAGVTFGEGKTFHSKTLIGKKGADGVCGARRSEVSA